MQGNRTFNKAFQELIRKSVDESRVLQGERGLFRVPVSSRAGLGASFVHYQTPLPRFSQTGGLCFGHGLHLSITALLFHVTCI